MTHYTSGYVNVCVRAAKHAISLPRCHVKVCNAQHNTGLGTSLRPGPSRGPSTHTLYGLSRCLLGDMGAPTLMLWLRCRSGSDPADTSAV
jgi:hypothetical protein